MSMCGGTVHMCEDVDIGRPGPRHGPRLTHAYPARRKIKNNRPSQRASTAGAAHPLDLVLRSCLVFAEERRSDCESTTLSLVTPPPRSPEMPQPVPKSALWSAPLVWCDAAACCITLRGRSRTRSLTPERAHPNGARSREVQRSDGLVQQPLLLRRRSSCRRRLLLLIHRDALRQVGEACIGWARAGAI